MTDHRVLSDEQLAKLVAQGGEEGEFALATLCQRHYKYIQRYVMSKVRNVDLVDDIVQKTFLKVVKNRQKLGEVEKVLAWITTIALHHVQDAFKIFRYHKVFTFSEIESELGLTYEIEFIEDKPGLDDECVEHEKIATLDEAIDHLSNTERTVTRIYLKHNMSHDEICSVLGINKGASKMRLCRGQRNITARIHDRLRPRSA